MYQKFNISVVIATRNRPIQLMNLLNLIELQTILPKEIIIIDSSDVILSYSSTGQIKIKYLHTHQKSTAKQRNLGIEEVQKGTDVLFFLDDDTIPDCNYFSQMVQTLVDTGGIGVSGIAENPGKNQRRKPSGIIGCIKRLTFLDSKIDGKLLLSGIPVPIRTNEQDLYQTDWLIGCSCWDFHKITNLKFEQDFEGYSLGEDVIFSVKAKKLGKLYVNSRIVLSHLELPQVDHDPIKFSFMWVYYRYRLRKYIDSPVLFYPTFYLSVLAKILYTTFSFVYKPKESTFQIIGISLGLLRILKDKYKR
jgi:glycosyltransferase involved in cell wall biosynthesis